MSDEEKELEKIRLLKILIVELEHFEALWNLAVSKLNKGPLA